MTGVVLTVGCPHHPHRTGGMIVIMAAAVVVFVVVESSCCLLCCRCPSQWCRSRVGSRARRPARHVDGGKGQQLPALQRKLRLRCERRRQAAADVDHDIRAVLDEFGKVVAAGDLDRPSAPVTASPIRSSDVVIAIVGQQTWAPGIGFPEGWCRTSPTMAGIFTGISDLISFDRSHPTPTRARLGQDSPRMDLASKNLTGGPNCDARHDAEPEQIKA